MNYLKMFGFEKKGSIEKYRDFCVVFAPPFLLHYAAPTYFNWGILMTGEILIKIHSPVYWIFRGRSSGYCDRRWQKSVFGKGVMKSFQLIFRDIMRLRYTRRSLVCVAEEVTCNFKLIVTFDVTLFQLASLQYARKKASEVSSTSKG